MSRVAGGESADTAAVLLSLERAVGRRSVGRFDDVLMGRDVGGVPAVASQLVITICFLQSRLGWVLLFRRCTALSARSCRHCVCFAPGLDSEGSSIKPKARAWNLAAPSTVCVDQVTWDLAWNRRACQPLKGHHPIRKLPFIGPAPSLPTRHSASCQSRHYSSDACAMQRVASGRFTGMSKRQSALPAGAPRAAPEWTASRSGLNRRAGAALVPGTMRKARAFLGRDSPRMGASKPVFVLAPHFALSFEY